MAREMDLTIAILQYLRMHKVEQKPERVLMSFHLLLQGNSLENPALHGCEEISSQYWTSFSKEISSKSLPLHLCEENSLQCGYSML